MKLRYVFAAALGLILAGVAVVAARVALLEDASESSAVLPETVEVFVAKSAIGFGTQVTEDMVARQPWPRAAVPHLAYTDPAQLFPTGEGARVAKGHFAEGEVLIATKLSVFGEEVRAVPVTDPARRAMAIRVRGEAVAGGLVQPGDQIDLLLAEGTGRDLRAVPLLQAVRVLGVGEGGLLTVEVTPQDGQRLALAQEAGVLVALLQLGAAVPGTAAAETLDLRALLGEAAPEATAPGGPSVVVRRGSETSIETVPTRGAD